MKHTETILVVDDDEAFKHFICNILKINGYTTISAADGLLALNKLRHHAIDLILSDVAMPNLNGYQMLAKMHQDAHLAKIPVIFISARDLDSDIRYGKTLGADDYLVKPIVIEDLLAVVRGKLLLNTIRNDKGDSLTRPVAVVETDPLPTLTVNLAEHRVMLDNRQIKLSAREFRLLASLCQGQGAIISPHSLLQSTHNFTTNEAEAGMLIRPLIRTLRRKLGFPAGKMGFIENVRSVGYRLATNRLKLLYQPDHFRRVRKTYEPNLFNMRRP